MNDFANFEKRLIDSLHWKLYRPTSFCFLIHLIPLFPEYKKDLYSLLHSMTFSGKFVSYSGSSLALGAIYWLTGHHVCGMWNSDVREVVILLNDVIR